VRVCFVSPYPLGMVSGISTLLLDLSDELRRKGHAGTFLGPAGDVRDPPMALMDIRLGPKEGTVALARRTARALRDAAGRFDLVHVQQPHPQTWAAARVARSLGSRTASRSGTSSSGRGWSSSASTPGRTSGPPPGP